MKREGISTLSICSYLRALSCFSSSLKFLLSVCVFENVFEKAFLFEFVIIHAGMYTKCLEMFRFGKVF